MVWMPVQGMHSLNKYLLITYIVSNTRGIIINKRAYALGVDSLMGEGILTGNQDLECSALCAGMEKQRRPQRHREEASDLTSGVREDRLEEWHLCWDVPLDNKGGKWEMEASSWQNELRKTHVQRRSMCKDPEVREKDMFSWAEHEESRTSPSVGTAWFNLSTPATKEETSKLGAEPKASVASFSLQLQVWRFSFTKAGGPRWPLKPQAQQLRALPAFITQGRKSSPEQKPFLSLSFALLTSI